MNSDEGGILVSNPAKLLGATPLFPASDLEQAIEFYEKKLGFTCAFRSGEPADYAGVQRDTVEIHLFQSSDRHLAEWTSCRIQVRNIEALYEEYKASGVIHPNGQLATKPWGLKEFSIIDITGVCVTFFER